MRRAVRSALVTAQVALALVLLVGAALLVESFVKLLAVPAGFRPDHVLTFRVALPQDGFEERESTTVVGPDARLSVDTHLDLIIDIASPSVT